MTRSLTRRRAAVALSTTVLLLTVAACGNDDGSETTADSSSDYTWTMVTDQAGLGDQGFNDLAKLGLDDSVSELGGTAQVIQSSEQSQYVTNLQQAVDSGATVTTGVGFLLADAMVEVAQDNPDANFTLIDSTAHDADDESLPNVAGVTFREQEASFLAGIVAGLTTQTNQIGFVGGIEIPAVVRFLSGFEAGLATVNPDAVVTTAYVGDFTDTAVASELASGFYDDGADIVFEVAGGAGLAVYQVASGLGADHWVIGTDTCKQQLAPENFLTSAVKDVAGTVLRQNRTAAEGAFQGGDIELGLADDAVGLCQDNYGDLSADIQALVETATAGISDGSIVPPGTADELTAYTPAPL